MIYNIDKSCVYEHICYTGISEYNSFKTLIQSLAQTS